jgi:5-methylcytosine-specific restriction endonuclease McrA
MTEQQAEFLKLAVIEQKTYLSISTTLNVSRAELSRWWEELKIERELLSASRNTWKSKFTDVDFWVFKEWIDTTPKLCYYCGITEEQIHQLWQKYPNLTKRTRGRKLEMDRKQPNEKYDNQENLVLSCYWCNNAKTDTFTKKEFLKVGQVIRGIWQERLSN